MRALVMCLFAGAVLTCPAPALAASAPDVGRPFVPRPVSRPVYEIKAPSEDPARQHHIVRAADGVEIWTETWLPKAKGGHVPPARVPTVLYLTPYASRGHPGYSSSGAGMERFVPRGYAWTVAHMRGTGGSGGCFDLLGPRSVRDGERIVEYVGRDAPWSSGAVGMYGLSFDGGSQVMVAALGDPNKTKYLKAIVPAGAVVSWYDNQFQDGVPHFLLGPAGPPAVFVAESMLGDPGAALVAQRLLERPGCLAELQLGSSDLSGDYTDFARGRDARRGLRNVKAAVLMVHGHADPSVPTMMQAGFFERLPGSTPKAGVFGVFEHEYPDRHDYQDPPAQPHWERPDWPPMVVAWYDRHLKGLDSRVEEWPVAQVQGTDGQWRAEPEWPTTGGPVGHLALGPAGVLGVSRPTGSTGYTEGELENTETETYAPGTSAVFETRPLPNRLELTGQPVLDAWVTLDRPDAHLAAKLELLGADGRKLPQGRDVGLRSMQHLDPLVENRFEQAHGKAPAVGSPVRARLRFQPADLVLPKGGRVRLTLAGSVIVFEGVGTIRRGGGVFFQGPSQPSGTATRVTVHHDCAHTSALRFLIARPNADLLNVREKDEPGRLADNRPFRRPVSDAGGLATGRVCGRLPLRLEELGPAIAYPRRPRLRLRLRHRRGRLPGGLRCARGRVRASIVGRDTRKIRRVRFFLGRRFVGTDSRRPFGRLVDRGRHRGPRHRHRARARVRMKDGRLARLSRTFRVCGRARR